MNFCLIYKKAKHCWALSANVFFLFSRYFFLIMFCFLLNWRKNSNCFKIAEWQSDSMKRNFKGFIFKLFFFIVFQPDVSMKMGPLLVNMEPFKDANMKKNFCNNKCNSKNWALNKAEHMFEKNKNKRIICDIFYVCLKKKKQNKKRKIASFLLLDVIISKSALNAACL